MSRHIKLGKIPSISLAIMACAWSWEIFKGLESDILPVVANFNVEVMERHGNSLYLSGSMDKLRDCRYVDLAVYDIAVNPMRILDIEFLDTPNTVQSRITGVQAWGVWKITPTTKNIQIVTRHECSTGIVNSVLYRGAI